MNCGQTELLVGTKVRIKSSPDKEDIGVTSVATHPFGCFCTDKGWIGIWVDEKYWGVVGDIYNCPVTSVEQI